MVPLELETDEPPRRPASLLFSLERAAAIFRALGTLDGRLAGSALPEARP